MHAKTDKQLKQEILRELKWDSRVAWGGIKVDVQEGVVMLAGVVSTYAEKLAAQQAVHRVFGVLDVANEIAVAADHASRSTDTQIAHAVRAALEWDVLVPDEEIHTTVADGWVTLEGKVNNLRERDDVERAVLRLAGVFGVVNKITVRPPEVDAEKLHAKIEEALERRAAREAERLRVEVKGDEVNLWGCVHTWKEKRAVLGSIRHAPGVRRVHDHLRIDPYA